MGGVVAFATYADLPGIAPDDEPVREALDRHGVQVRAHVWNDPSVDWSAVDLCLLRSTWDYHHHCEAFLAWADHVASVTRLVNPLDVVRWNSDKRYLRDLADSGIPIIPTVWLSQDRWADLSELLAAQGWTQAVIKPAISASSEGTMLVTPSSLKEGQAHLERLLPAGDVIIQPFVTSVTEGGEHSLTVIDGEVTHAVRRGDVFGERRVEEILMSASPEEVTLARDALHAVGQPVTYARVDVAMEGGRPFLMELELIEPWLSLSLAPWSGERFADAIVRQLGAASS